MKCCRDTPPTRARILDAAVRRFGRVGYGGASLEDIAGDVGISKAAIYHHFRNKDAILAALIEALRKGVERLYSDLRALDVPFPVLLERLIEHRLDMAKRYPHWIHFMLRLDLSAGDLPDVEGLLRMHAEFHRAEEVLLGDRLGDFPLRAGITVDQLVQFSHDAVFAFIARKLMDGSGGVGDPSIEARRLRDLILYGVSGKTV
jgi:AcrR family transcriptional regulator